MSATGESLIEKALTTMRRHAMLSARGALLLAVSGGPDSLALLHLMKRLCDRERPGLALHAAHLHHGIRGHEADADAEFVARETARLGVPLVTRHVNIPELARQRGIGVEQAGRDARYAFLVETALTVGAKRIALGHQADDQAETVLMRARRGTGPRGAIGIPYVRPAGAALIVRPLLDCTRAEIEAFLAAEGLRGRLDATNLSTHYLRNLMRARIIPALRQEWGESLQPQLCALAAAAQRLRSQAERLSIQYRGIARVSDGEVELDARALSPLRESLFPDLLRGWLERAGLWRRTLGGTDYERLAQLLSPEFTEGTVNLPGGLIARRPGEMFIIRAGSQGPSGGARCPQRAKIEYPPVTLVEGGLTDLGSLGRIEAHEVTGGIELLARRASPFEEFLDRDHIEGKLEVRAPRPGDRMRPLGAPGSRKLQDILTDLRVPSRQRRRLPVLTADGRPIWLVGHRIAHGVRLTERTRRALHLRFVATESV